ncbi:MAG TPA: DUF3037 domain-containing protein [Trinickia sp.]|jgi:hypothetical protein|nr:DUF3037 domain-containing protein [Trinickia sp.]
MTSHIARYCTLQFQPHHNRTEHVNYGIVVFMPNGGVRVHIANGLRKIKALAPTASVERLRAQEAEIPKIVGDARCDEALRLLEVLQVLRPQAVARLGTFRFETEADYVKHAKLALATQCETPVARGRAREPRSRLFYDVRDRFQLLGILAEDKAALPDHQVVEHYTPDAEADVKVEFALQNGILRVAQTIDLRTDAAELVSTQHKHAAYSKAYAIHYAKTQLESARLRSYVIVAGAHSTAADRVLTAIRADADDVLDWENHADMERFFGEWAEAAGRPLPSLPLN